jgi:predicted amidohydrolase YtcJ
VISTDFAAMAIVNARVWSGTSERGDAIAFRAGKVVALGDAKTVLERLPRRREVIDAHGALLVPGFVDAHTHIRAAASARASFDLAGCRSVDRVLEAIRRASVEHSERRWLSFVNVSLSNPPDPQLLAAAGNGRFVRLRHHSLHAWSFDQTALGYLGLAPTSEWILDHGGDLARRMGRLTEPRLFEAALREWSAGLLSQGVVALVDASATNGSAELAALADWRKRGLLAQHTVALVEDSFVGAAPGVPIIGAKIACAPGPQLIERLTVRLRAAWASHSLVAVHCPDTESLGALLEAVGAIGPGAGALRIEHASVCPPDWIAHVARIGATIVTHPAFIWAHGDRYLAGDNEPTEWLYRLGSWRDARVRVAFGSDAPVGPAEPMIALDAALERRTSSGTLLAARESLSLDDALRCMTAAAADASAIEGFGRLKSGGPAAAVLLSGNAPELTIDGVVAIDRWIA